MTAVAELADNFATASRPLYGVIGPTASGKSALAVELAKRVGGEVLAVDSMTVYRGMDVGTAKPTPEERAAVVHHGIDVVSPAETFTVARFVQMADAQIADNAGRGVPLVLVGGTPMYWKALLEGLFDGPTGDPAVRAAIDAMPADELVAAVAEVDPAAAARIHRNDRRRLTRALEVYRLTGRSLTEQQGQWDRGQRRHDVTLIGLRWEREQLNRRINARTKQMIAAGWVEEVRELLAEHGELSDTALEAAGYRALVRHVSGRMKLDDAIEQIKIGTRQLAKRQVRWFRTFADVDWVDGATLTP